MKTKGQYSIERLVHFQCGACFKYWAVGDPEARSVWFCTWCGVEQSFEGTEQWVKRDPS